MDTYTLIETHPDDPRLQAILKLIYPDALLALKQDEGINHKLLRHTYLVLKAEVPAARCLVYHNPEIEWEGKKTALIGNFECIEEEEPAALLLKEVFRQLKTKGFDYVIGPMNGSTWDSYRFPVSGDFPLFFLEPPFPNYYPKYWLNSGFEKMASYMSNREESSFIKDLKAEQTAARLAEEGFIIREVDPAHFNDELEKMYFFCMEAFKSNYLFSSIEKEYFKDKYMKALPFMKKEFVLLAEDKAGDLAGFIFCLPNYLDATGKSLIAKTIARSPKRNARGMGNVLLYQLKQRASLHGFDSIIHAFMYESNSSRALSNHYQSLPIREYHLYGKTL